MKKPDITNGAGDLSAFGIPHSKLLTKLDQLNSLLTSGTWDDLSSKGERSLMVFVNGSTVRALVKIGNPPLKLSAVGRSIDEALVALDALLNASDTPWEDDSGRSGTRKGKGK